MTVADIIQGCIKQDRRAQRELFYRYSKTLMATAHRYTREEAAAKDVVQESFIKIFKMLHQLKQHEEPSLMAWMKKITARQALQWIKKNKSFQLRQFAQTTEIEHASDHLHINDVMVALETLPTGYKTVLQLHVIEGFSHKEIGEMLGIATSSSRSQLTRARAMFSNKWSELVNYYGNVEQ